MDLKGQPSTLTELGGGTLLQCPPPPVRSNAIIILRVHPASLETSGIDRYDKMLFLDNWWLPQIQKFTTLEHCEILKVGWSDPFEVNL